MSDDANPDGPIYVLCDRPDLARSALARAGIPTIDFTSNFNPKYRIASSTDHLRGGPRGFDYFILGKPRQALIDLANERQGSEIDKPAGIEL